MDTFEETNVKATAAKRAWDTTVLVLQRLRGVSDGFGTYWESGTLNQHLELAGIAVWVAGCKNLGLRLIRFSHRLPEEPNTSQANEAVEQLTSLEKPVRELTLRLNPHLR